MYGQYGPAKADIGQAGTALGNVTNWAQGLLAGGPQAAQVLAPQISQIQQQAGQQRATGAQFGTRSGGTAAANQAIGTQTSNAIDTLLGQVTAAAPSIEAQAAANLGNLGLGIQGVATRAGLGAAQLSSQDYAREKAAQEANIGAALALATMGIGGAMGGADLGDIGSTMDLGISV
jgi:hypothetical protein